MRIKRIKVQMAYAHTEVLQRGLLGKFFDCQLTRCDCQEIFVIQMGIVDDVLVIGEGNNRITVLFVLRL